MKRRCIALANLFLACGAAQAADDLAAIRWDVELSRPAAMSIELVRGETVNLEPRLLSYSAPLDLTNCTAVVLRYRSADMTDYYAVTGLVASAADGRMRVTWTPACEAAATNYLFTFAASMPSGSTLRVFGKIKLLGSVGTGDVVPAPRVLTYIDWAALEHAHIEQAPFSNGSGSDQVARAEASIALATAQLWPAVSNVVMQNASAGATAVQPDRTITFNGVAGTLASNLSFVVSGGDPSTWSDYPATNLFVSFPNYDPISLRTEILGPVGAGLYLMSARTNAYIGVVDDGSAGPVINTKGRLDVQGYAITNVGYLYGEDNYGIALDLGRGDAYGLDGSIRFDWSHSMADGIALHLFGDIRGDGFKASNMIFQGDASLLTNFPPLVVTTNAQAWIGTTNTAVTIAITNILERSQYLSATGAVVLAFAGLRPPLPMYLIIRGPDAVTFPVGTHFIGGASWQTNRANHFLIWQQSSNLFVNPITTSED